ncbi:MAG: uroporphyrinogen III methyltransferase / synthase [Chloroflexi bacterium]|jgi:uroporphyrinogen III methyltransferase/synthase|nr:MAG: uroporphyrinogen III methyltransferase / synthase [Chloroflexota bacterium]
MSGIVYLVGAGPGDPGLITVKALRLLQRADVVVYDRLANPELLAEARSGAELIDAGKAPGDQRLTQDETNALLVELGKQGKTVVRLKGGDPFVFGRGGEEALALAEAGVPFEVVPGVTSAVAVPAHAGIPVTHRGASTSVAFVTGNEDPTKEESQVNWKALATAAETLVVLMGLGNLPQIAEELNIGGLPLDCPVALIQQGAGPKQRTVVGNLGNIADLAHSEGLKPPVIAVFGNVVKLRERIAWYDTRPLFGKRVLVTRTRQQASTLAEQLAERGAEAIELPSIAIQAIQNNNSLEEAFSDLSSYHWLVFTSTNGVDIFFDHLRSSGMDTRSLAGVRVCAIGPATASAISAHGIVADLVPERFVSEALVEALAQKGIKDKNILVARAEAGREELRHGLEAAGANVNDIALYRTVIPSESQGRARDVFDAGVDIVTFASSSTVRNLIELLGGDISLLKTATVACIGPVTAATARDMGLTVHVEAQEYTIPGLVQALIDHLESGGG